MKTKLGSTPPTARPVPASLDPAAPPATQAGPASPEAPIGQLGLASTAPRARSAAPGKTATLGGHGLAVKGEPGPEVKGKALRAALTEAYRASENAFEYAGSSRKPDNAYPLILAGRKAVWAAVDDLVAKKGKAQPAALKAALGELASFRETWRYSVDEANVPRIWHGYRRLKDDGELIARPGLIELLGAVFQAAGMGAVEPKPRPWS